MSNEPARKNLVVLHLESMSQTTFWQYSAVMPTLFSLMRQSASFSNFFASSTSSVMSMGDFMFGDSSELDHLPVFPKTRNVVAGKSSNLFQFLHDNGYATHGVQYFSVDLKDCANNFYGIWPDACGEFRWENDRERLHRDTRSFLEQARTASQPFALYFWDLSSHLRHDDPRKGISYQDRFRDGYQLIDASVKRLVDDLGQLGFLENTMIVAFGDHGDDLWRHGMYRGRSHIIDPYATVCWCPLFINSSDVTPSISPQLASTVDLKATIRHILFPELPAEPRTSPFAGIDLLGAERGVAFSQSMFALQLERSDPARALTKSYAVTNGDLRVMASTGGAEADDAGGMELFLEQWDYADTRNILDFCRLNKDGYIVGFGLPDAVHPHFRLTFTPKFVEQMIQTYESLRKMLGQYIKLKEKEAGKYFAGGDKHLFPDDVFTRSRARRR